LDGGSRAESFSERLYHPNRGDWLGLSLSNYTSPYPGGGIPFSKLVTPKVVFFIFVVSFVQRKSGQRDKRSRKTKSAKEE